MAAVSIPGHQQAASVWPVWILNTGAPLILVVLYVCDSYLGLLTTLCTLISKGPVTRGDAAHPRWDVLKPPRCIKIACNALRCFSNMLEIWLPILEYLSCSSSDFQTIFSIMMSFYSPFYAICELKLTVECF